MNFNDGSVGFIKKIVSTQKFHYKISNVGVDDRFEYELPMINLIKLHGSVNWKIEKDNNQLSIDNSMLEKLQMNNGKIPSLNMVLSKEDLNKRKDINDTITTLNTNLKEYDISDVFYKLINEIAIVKPSKDKFSETVFEEHYYQSLRIFTQELERNQSVLIVFGFSFQDEHILSLTKRSLNNPGLMIFLFVYDQDNIGQYQEKFSYFKNIRFICNNYEINTYETDTKSAKGKCDFKFFNSCLSAQDYE